MNSLTLILGDLKTKGYKLTAVRKSLVEILLKSSHPLSINDLILELKSKKLNPNKTTFYREVSFLKNLEILQVIDFGDGKKRYEISKDHHHHIVCINCKKVLDIPMEEDLDITEKKILRQMEFKPVGHSLEFFGLCKECQ